MKWEEVREWIEAEIARLTDSLLSDHPHEMTIQLRAKVRVLKEVLALEKEKGKPQWQFPDRDEE